MITKQSNSWRERFKFKFKDYVLYFSKNKSIALYRAEEIIEELIEQERINAQIETIEFIAKGEGWEDSEIYYLRQMGLNGEADKKLEELRKIKQ